MLLTSSDSLWQMGKLRPQAGVSSSRGGAAEGGPLSGTPGLCMQPSWGGHVQGARCVAAVSSLAASSARWAVLPSPTADQAGK